MAKVADVPYLNLAFQNGARLRSGYHRVVVDTLEIAQLALPSGQVVVTDPFTQPDAPALTRRVPPGRYPVVVSLLREPESFFTTVAAALLRLGDGAPVRWQAATTPAQDASPLEPFATFGCMVNTGNAAFMSLEAAGLLAEHLSLFGTLDLDLVERICQKLAANALTAGAAWADVPLEGDSGLNAVLFQSGRGEGYYASYWGLDGDDQVVGLAMDFGLLSS